MYFTFVCLGCLLISDPPLKSGSVDMLQRSGHTYQAANMDDADASSLSSDKCGPKELDACALLSTPLAWHLASCLVTTSVGGMYLAGSFKTYAVRTLSASSLATISTTASVFNSVGRIFWGYTADKIGSLPTLAILAGLFSVIILTYSSSLEIGGEAGFALSTYLLFFFEGGNFALYMPITIQLFGSRWSSSNYGLIFTLFSLSAMMNIIFLSRLKVDFWTASVSMGLFTLTGFINVMLFIRHVHVRTTGGASVFSCARF